MAISVTLEASGFGDTTSTTITNVDLVEGERLLLVVDFWRSNTLNPWLPGSQIGVLSNATGPLTWAPVGASAWNGYSGFFGLQSGLAAMLSSPVQRTESGVTLTIDFDTASAATGAHSVGLLRLASDSGGDIVCFQTAGYSHGTGSGSTTPSARWPVAPTGVVVAAFGGVGATVGSAPVGYTQLYSHTGMVDTKVFAGASTQNPAISMSGTTSYGRHVLALEFREQDPAYAAPTIRGTESTGFTPTTTWAVDMPAAVNEGDQLVAFLTCHHATTAATFTPPSGWTSLTRLVNSDSGQQVIEIFSKGVVDGTEDGDTETWTASTAVRGVALVMAVADAGRLVTSPQGDDGTSTSALPRAHGLGGTIESLLVALVAMYEDDATATSFPSGWSYLTGNQVSGGGTNNGASLAFAARRSGTVPYATPGSFGLSQSEGWLAFTVAFPAATPAVEPAPGVYFVAEGEASLLDGTWSTATASTCRLLVDADHIGLRTDDEVKLLIASDLEEPTFPGYATTALTSGGWTVVPGTPTTATHTDRVYTLTGAPVDPVTVDGYFVTRNSDGALIFFEIFDGGPWVLEAEDDQITVTPAFTLKGVRPV